MKKVDYDPQNILSRISSIEISISFLEKMIYLMDKVVNTMKDSSLNEEKKENFYNKKIFNAKESAEFLNLKKTTCLNHLKSGKLKGELVGRIWCIHYQDLMDYKKRR